MKLPLAVSTANVSNLDSSNLRNYILLDLSLAQSWRAEPRSPKSSFPPILNSCQALLLQAPLASQLLFFPKTKLSYLLLSIHIKHKSKKQKNQRRKYQLNCLILYIYSCLHIKYLHILSTKLKTHSERFQLLVTQLLVFLMKILLSKPLKKNLMTF